MNTLISRNLPRLHLSFVTIVTVSIVNVIRYGRPYNRFLCVHFTARFVQTASGKAELLFLYGYTYSKGSCIRNGGFRYRCSKMLSYGCPAHLHLSKEGEILKLATNHSHEAPPHEFSEEGFYVPIKPAQDVSLRGLKREDTRKLL